MNSPAAVQQPQGAQVDNKGNSNRDTPPNRATSAGYINIGYTPPKMQGLGDDSVQPSSPSVYFSYVP